MREKLIELIREIEKRIIVAADMSFEEKKECMYRQMADRLIANGVTISGTEDTPVADNLSTTDDKVSAVDGWIPVTERLPERDTVVLVCDTREDYVSVWEYMGDGLWYGNDVIWATEDVTHWMPLPTPPKGE